MWYENVRQSIIAELNLSHLKDEPKPNFYNTEETTAL